MNFKNTIPGLMLLGAVALACSTQKPDGYTLIGTIHGVGNGTVKLTRYNDADRTTTVVDSAVITDGSFEMNGVLDGPEMLSFTVVPGNWQFSAFIENNEITLTADTTGAMHYDYSAHPGGSKGARIETVTVVGSASHDQYRSLEDDPEGKPFREAMMALRSRQTDMENMTPEEKAALRRESDSLRRAQTAWKEQQIERFVKANPSSVVGPYAFQRYAQMNNSLSLEERESMLSRFEGEALESPYYKLLNEDYQQRAALAVGRVAPDFTALRPDSTEFVLSSTRGQYVLLDFWASWCVPCRNSIPHWKEIYAEYSDRGLEIVAVTNDSKWSDWLQALKEEQMPWIQVTDDFPVERMPARIATLYKVPVLPSYVLLDPEGRIVLYRASKDEITAEIKKRLI